MGRLISTTTNYAFVPGTYTNAYSYDAASNRASLTAPDGSISTYGYDTLNRLNGLANSWAGSFGFSYDALSRRTQLTRPNGVNTNYSYDGVVAPAVGAAPGGREHAGRGELYVRCGGKSGCRDAPSFDERAVVPLPALFTRSCCFHHALSTTSSATRATKSL
jgi:YD repeat-containing protein